ncbi:selenite/tellurite reduction operon protein ExtJ [Geomonas edaphica]|uniref:selenite/tellurite reduction operon protein ExtJ n=1 Tax=Geomonas edaphica TaxID=2570226 RepID=UPI0010A8ABA4|nr:selenite/tellurite reduction operon protein ExtJ [Geomonas edaphica]
MFRKLICVTAAALSVASFAFAAGSMTGTVRRIEGDKVTVKVAGAVPAWAKKGTAVSISGASPSIVAVQGDEVTLKMTKAKAEKLKVDAPLTLTESAGDELQGC